MIECWRTNLQTVSWNDPWRIWLCLAVPASQSGKWTWTGLESSVVHIPTYTYTMYKYKVQTHWQTGCTLIILNRVNCHQNTCQKWPCFPHSPSIVSSIMIALRPLFPPQSLDLTLESSSRGTRCYVRAETMPVYWLLVHVKYWYLRTEYRVWCDVLFFVLYTEYFILYIIALSDGRG